MAKKRYKTISVSLDKYIEAALKRANKKMVGDYLFDADARLEDYDKLDLSGDGLTDLNDEFLEFENINTLRLDGNNFTHFPKLVCRFKRLERLSVRSCDLIISSKNFIKCDMLARLEYLDLSENYFVEFPKTLCRCKRLKTLGLEDCNITSLPENIALLQELEILELYFNPNLKALPKAFCKLKKLEWLNLSYCGLKNLPDEFGNLQSLEKLTLQGNDFEDFPKVIFDLKNLKELIIDEKLISQDIAKQLDEKGICLKWGY